jgi:hypothetical protein
MAYRPQPDDTYFVEDASYPPQRATHDYIKMVGRRRQEAMANELSRQACDTYMEDIIQHMHEMEVNNLTSCFSCSMLTINRMLHFLTLPQLTFNKRFNGL